MDRTLEIVGQLYVICRVLIDVVETFVGTAFYVSFAGVPSAVRYFMSCLVDGWRPFICSTPSLHFLPFVVRVLVVVCSYCEVRIVSDIFFRVLSSDESIFGHSPPSF